MQSQTGNYELTQSNQIIQRQQQYVLNIQQQDEVNIQYSNQAIVSSLKPQQIQNPNFQSVQLKTPQNSNNLIVSSSQIQSSRNNTEPPENYISPKFPRPEIPADCEDDGVGLDCYQWHLYKHGQFWGTIKSYVPCLICCIDYPYIRVDQSFFGIQERFGRYVKTVKPGLIFVNPCTDNLQLVDCKINVIDCPRQFVMTKDNITLNIDAAVYYRVIVPRQSVYNINNLEQDVTQVTLATIKTIVGSNKLQDLLEKRHNIQVELQSFIEAHVWEWGIQIQSTVIKDIQLSLEVQHDLQMAAEARRQAQANIINARADLECAKLLSQTATFLDSEASMQIRYLEIVQSIGYKNNTKVIFIPEKVDVLN